MARWAALCHSISNCNGRSRLSGVVVELVGKWAVQVDIMDTILPT